MSLLTTYDLEALRDEERKATRFFGLNEAKVIRERGRSLGEKYVFLSHKHSEKGILESVVMLLNNLGVSVYLDWQDAAMPKSTSGYTARRIKSKIRQSDKFILVATEAAIASKWCNWELGYGDAKKYPDNIAILPIRQGFSHFTGSEYLAIYSRIEQRSEYTSGYAVIHPDGSRLSLSMWMTKR